MYQLTYKNMFSFACAQKSQIFSNLAVCLTLDKAAIIQGVLRENHTVHIIDYWRGIFDTRFFCWIWRYLGRSRPDLENCVRVHQPTDKKRTFFRAGIRRVSGGGSISAAHAGGHTTASATAARKAGPTGIRLRSGFGWIGRNSRWSRFQLQKLGP